MIILTDCISSKVDEGCIKTATKVSKLMRDKYNCKIFAINKESDIADKNYKLNKLYINFSFLKALRKMNEKVLFIPVASNTLGSAIRILILSLFLKKDITTIFTLRWQMNRLTCFLLSISKVKIVVLSNKSCQYYKGKLSNKILYLKTGVDTAKFCPINKTDKERLRNKYKIDNNKHVILHVGHIRPGRNLEKLITLNSAYQILIVISSVTNPVDEIKEKLLSCNNIQIIDSYISNIEELYQLSDIYLFPVLQENFCIDVPLSVLEAASCNIRVITTRYEELAELNNGEGLEFIETCTEEELNMYADRILKEKRVNTRDKVIGYDWEISVEKLYKFIND